MCIFPEEQTLDANDLWEWTSLEFSLTKTVFSGSFSGSVIVQSRTLSHMGSTQQDIVC